MRISDWSSDVCSSDLSVPPQACLGEGDRRPQAVGGGASASSVKPLHQLRWSPSPSKLGEDRVGRNHRWAAHRSVQIGRASCRERGCQYVQISVVAVSSTTKQKPRKTNKRIAEKQE